MHRSCVAAAVNGGWSEWSESGSCSAACGDGTQTYFRECNDPEPANGGDDCEGDELKTEACNDGDCPPCGAETASVFLASDTDVLVGAASIPETPAGDTITVTCPDDEGYGGAFALECGEDGNWPFEGEILTDECTLGEFGALSGTLCCWL